ncbi:MAG: flippase-like domain-containing protein [Planctomycetes bacterium]|nr:flippase-like domain-containing protein [Planctomycetota bacterium]
MRLMGRKTLIIVAKIIVAVVLCMLVAARVHWHDYVLSDSGESWVIVAPQGQDGYVVTRGMLWWTTHTTLAKEHLIAVDAAAGQYKRLGFASSIATIRPVVLAGAWAAYLICLLITAARWWILLRIQDIRITPWEAVRLTFVGLFFNYVVPGTVGGDLVKAYYVSKHTDRKAAALVSVFVDRVLGFTELTAMAGVMIAAVSVLSLPGCERMARPAIAISAVLVAVVGALAFLLSSRFRGFFPLQKIYRRLPIAHHIAAAGAAARLYRRRIGVLARAIAITFGAHVFFVGSIALMGMSLSIEVPWYSYFIYVPLIYIAGAVPISPGGVGLIEGLFQVFFVGGMSCEPGEILALALLARIVPMLWGIPGAIVAVTGPKLPKTDLIEAELGVVDDIGQ